MTKLRNWIYDHETILMVYGLIGIACLCAIGVGPTIAGLWTNGHFNW